MKITTYAQAKTYLESCIQESSYKKDAGADLLARMRKLLTLLDNPQKKFLSVIVTGTAGKGSTAYLLSHILATAGYKTGLTISPHLQKLNERMQINNREISEEEFITLLNDMIPAIEEMDTTGFGKPTYFEILLSLAFLYFAREKVDIVIAEVGLEGRYDGTNVLSPMMTILTNISLDHTEILGDTAEKIAREAVYAIKKYQAFSRSEILLRKTNIKYQGTVITGAKQQSVLEIIKKRCAGEEIENLFILGPDIRYSLKSSTLRGSVFSFENNELSFSSLHLSLLGEYQVENATLAIQGAEALRKYGFTVSEQAMSHALSTAKFPGRFEILSSKIHDTKHVILLDGAHNEEKMRAFLSALQKLYPKKKKYFIVAFKKDKDIKNMITQITPVADRIIITQFHGMTDMRKNASMDPKEILVTLKAQDYHTCLITKSLTEAFLEIDSSIDYEQNQIIVITGSLYLVGEARELLENLISVS